MNLAIIVGGWYFPYDLYFKLKLLKIPENWNVDFYVVTHRNPNDIPLQEMFSRSVENSHNSYIHEYNHKLYARIITLDELRGMGYTVYEEENVIGDYYFFNQWCERVNYKQYDYFMFMHDDNFLLLPFATLLTDADTGTWDLFSYYEDKENDEKQWVPVKRKRTIRNIDYIANSAVGNFKTARGSFSIWSKKLINKLPNNRFSMEGVELIRTGLTDTPMDREDTDQWNIVGRNFQNFIDSSGLMKSSYRFSPLYRTSKYMFEGERGLISLGGIRELKNDTALGILKYG